MIKLADFKKNVNIMMQNVGDNNFCQFKIWKHCFQT